MKAGQAVRTYPLTFAALIAAGAFCIVTAFFNLAAAGIELCVLLVLVLIAVLRARRDFRIVRETVLALSESFTAEENSALQNFPLPVVVFDNADRVIWYNLKFKNELLPARTVKSADVRQFTGGLGLSQIRKKERFDAVVDGKSYTVYFSHIDCRGRQSYVLLYAEDTRLKQIAHAYEMEKPAVAMVAIDSVDEIYRAYKESEYAEISGAVERITEGWFTQYPGLFRKLGSGRFLAVIPEEALLKMVASKFRVLELVRGYTYRDAPVGVTLSIGVGRGDNLSDAESNARQALDMALGRGGDQAALKNTDDTYRFFGGVSKGVEKRTKVRTRVVASAIGELIRGSDNVLIMGHQYSDLDCIGAAIGMCKAARDLGKDAFIVTNARTTLAASLVEYAAKQGAGDWFVLPEHAERLLSEKTLLFVVDTHKASFVEAPELCEKAPGIVVIDHHRKTVDFIQNAVIFYHEPHASSTCEMVTELLQYMNGKPLVTPLCANALLAGIILDTKDFVLRTGVRTFEAAAYLRSRGADTVVVKRFFNSSMENKKLRGQIVLNAQSYRRCAVSVADVQTKDIRVICAQAADELLTVSDVDASFVLFETDGTANISARSMGNINVQLVMEALGGGGHQTMAAAQLPDTTLDEAKQKLFEAIDAYFENQ